ASRYRAHRLRIPTVNISPPAYIEGGIHFPLFFLSLLSWLCGSDRDPFRTQRRVAVGHRYPRGVSCSSRPPHGALDLSRFRIAPELSRRAYRAVLQSRPSHHRSACPTASCPRP